MLPNQLVVVAVPNSLFDVEISNFSRYGTQQEIELPAGDYTLTCVGLVPSLAWDVPTLLRKSGFINHDVLHFAIKEGETTVLEARTTILKRRAALMPIHFREIVVTVLERGAPVAEAVINTRTASSIAWRDYHGPLKPAK